MQKPEGVKASGYLPSLDGWRAVAILGVLMTHDLPWRLLGHTNLGWRGLGGDGVLLFFAISGLLICTRILEEERRIGRFRIGAFYIRRLFRIQPAAFAYLAVIAVLILAGVVHERWHFWLGALFLYENFLFHTRRWDLIMAGYFTGHFWTLALEEHFYILLSLFLYFVRRNRILVMLLLLVLLNVGQAVGQAKGWYSVDTSTRRTYWLLQYLLFPSWLAMLLRHEAVYAWAVRWWRPWVAVLCTLLVVMVDALHRFGLRRVPLLTLVWTEANVVIWSFGFLLIATMLHGRSWSTRVLEWAPLRFIGRLSYSIYLWHLLFYCTGEPDTHITWAPLVILGERPWRYIATFGLAALSYFLVEKPMIRLGHRLAPPVTPGHAELAG